MARHFNNWLQAYMQYTSASESPDAFHFWTGVWTIAGALRRRVWIDQNNFQWTPNFYVILVAPPGMSAKSTTMRQGINLLSKVKGINFGPQSATWQALAAALEEAEEYVEFPIAGAKEDPMRMRMACINSAISELGTFFRPDDGQMINVLTDLWDGQKGEWFHATKTTGTTTIANPWLNVIGCTTPTWIRANIPETMIGGGLMSRIIFVYADTKRKLVAYPSRVMKAKDFEKNEQMLIEDLTDIASMKGEFKMTEDAYAWGEEWYKKLHHSPPAHLQDERFGGYISRKQGHLHKLAMIISAAKSSMKQITDKHLAEAEALLNAAEPYMQTVFNFIGKVDQARHIDILIGAVKQAGEVELGELNERVYSQMSGRDFKEALELAVKLGKLTYATVTIEGNKTAIIRPA